MMEETIKARPNSDYSIIDFVVDIDVTKATKMAVIVFNDDDTTECGYYNMNFTNNISMLLNACKTYYS